MTEPLTPGSKPKASFDQVFPAEYEKVWRALQLSVQKYPIRINDIDRGVLETDFIRGAKSYSPPHLPPQNFSGRQYQLLFRVLKGKIEGRPAIKVVIVKKMERKRDFFSENEELKSDGLEEKTILYRIAREIEIDRAITKKNSN